MTTEEKRSCLSAIALAGMVDECRKHAENDKAPLIPDSALWLAFEHARELLDTAAACLTKAALTEINAEPPATRPDPARPLVVKAAKSTLPAFLARLRAANPGARFAFSEANVALLGTAPDLEAHRRLRDDEAMILEKP